MSFPNQTQKTNYEIITSHKDVTVNMKGNFSQNGNTHLWYLLKYSFYAEKWYPYYKRPLCATKEPTKQNIYFSSYPLSWPIYGPSCNEVSVTRVATHNLVPRYEPQAFVPFIKVAQKGCLDQGEAAPAGPCCVYTGFLTNLTCDTKTFWTRV